MVGWIEQWYGNDPAVANVWVPPPFGSSSRSKLLSSAVNVWATPCVFLMSTAEPAFTVSVGGEKANSATVIVEPPPAAAVVAAPPAAVVAAPAAVVAAAAVVG